jgi:hypothetical protein
MTGIKATQIVVYETAICVRGFINYAIKLLCQLTDSFLFVGSLCQAGNKFRVLCSFITLVGCNQ